MQNFLHIELKPLILHIYFKGFFTADTKLELTVSNIEEDTDVLRCGQYSPPLSTSITFSILTHGIQKYGYL